MNADEKEILDAIGHIKKIHTPSEEFRSRLEKKLVHMDSSSWSKVSQRKGASFMLRWMLSLTSLLVAVAAIAALLINPTASMATSDFNGKENKTINILFSRPMNQKTVEKAIQVQPFAKYKVSWHHHNLLITFNDLTAGESYKLTINKSARAVLGPGLEKDFTVHFYGPVIKQPAYKKETRNIDIPLRAREFVLEKTMNVPWSQDEKSKILTGAQNGQYTSRLIPEHAVMDDLQRVWPNWSQDYGNPQLVSVSETTAYLEALSMDQHKMLGLTMENILSNGKYNLWILTKIEFKKE